MAKWKPDEKYKKINLALDLITRAIILILSICTVLFWLNAPERVPIHFNIEGQIDGYASKNTLFFVLGIIIMAYIVLYLISRHPSLGNYITPIHEGNKEIQYNMMHTFIKIINLELVILFSYMQFQLIRGTGFEGAILLIPLGIIATSTAIYGRLSSKYK